MANWLFPIQLNAPRRKITQIFEKVKPGSAVSYVRDNRRHSSLDGNDRAPGQDRALPSRFVSPRRGPRAGGQQRLSTHA